MSTLSKQIESRRKTTKIVSTPKGKKVSKKKAKIIKVVRDTVNPVNALDTQVGGGHYKDMVIQPIEFIQKNKLNFCEGNVIKYICRHKSKNGIEDLKKVKHYIDLLIELEYKGQA